MREKITIPTIYFVIIILGIIVLLTIVMLQDNLIDLQDRHIEILRDRINSQSDFTDKLLRL